MTTNNMQTKYKIPTTREQYNYLCGILLPQIQAAFGVDRKTAHKRMRDRLIEWGYIKRSRSELNYHQTIEITQRFKNYLAKQVKTMTDLEKAKILYECQFWMAGNGHFNLNPEDVAEVLRLMRTKKTTEALRGALRDFYDNHPKAKAVDRGLEENYLEY